MLRKRIEKPLKDFIIERLFSYFFNKKKRFHIFFNSNSFVVRPFHKRKNIKKMQICLVEEKGFNIDGDFNLI
jgi:hypothetical protein